MQIHENTFTMKTSKKKILFACALEKELKIAKMYFKKHKPEWILIDFLCTGIGNINMTLELSKKLWEKPYDFVVNFWVCGYKDLKEDIIQVVRSVYSPTVKEIITPVFFHFAPLRSIYCSETAVYDSSELWEENYCDMESWAFEKVCENFRVPRIILKVPVDKIGAETLNFNISKALKLLEENIKFKALIQKTETYLWSLSQEIHIDNYLSHYKLTVSEEIIMKKCILKYHSLSQENFNIFFNQHKGLNKKEFLKTLSTSLDTFSL